MAVALTTSSAHGAAAQSTTGDSALAPLVGAYRFGPSRDVVVSTLRIGPRVGLLLADLQSDALRVLFPGEGADLYTAGPALARPAPTEQRIRFVRQQGVVVAAERQWLDAGRVIRSDTARRIPFRERPARFADGDVLLQGTLYVPATAGPHPAVVLAHGSEDNDRHSFGPIPFALVSRGFGVLVYDKRGTGRSSGSWRTVGLEPLAQDVAAGVAWLRKQPGIDPKRVGIYGTSEGGWVAAAASVRVPGVAFIVTASGGARTKADAYLHKVRRQLDGEPLSASARDSAVRATVAFLDSSRVRASQADAAGFDRRLAYDPTEHWTRGTAPVLHLEGEFDVLQSGPSAAAWYEALHRRAGHADATVKLFPKAHHSLLQGVSGTAAEFDSAEGLTQMATGYWDVLLGWLAGHAHR
jgi:dienelactone hydrolase